MKSINLNTILLIGIIALATWQIRGCFTKTPLPEKMIRNEERIKYLEAQRLTDSVALIETRVKYDSLVTVSIQKSEQLAGKFKATKVIYETIPVIINSYDREQLRRGVSDF